MMALQSTNNSIAKNSDCNKRVRENICYGGPTNDEVFNILNNIPRDSNGLKKVGMKNSEYFSHSYNQGEVYTLGKYKQGRNIYFEVMLGNTKIFVPNNCFDFLLRLQFSKKGFLYESPENKKNYELLCALGFREIVLYYEGRGYFFTSDKSEVIRKEDKTSTEVNLTDVPEELFRYEFGSMKVCTLGRYKHGKQFFYVLHFSGVEIHIPKRLFEFLLKLQRNIGEYISEASTNINLFNQLSQFFRNNNIKLPIKYEPGKGIKLEGSMNTPRIKEVELNIKDKEKFRYISETHDIETLGKVRINRNIHYRLRVGDYVVLLPADLYIFLMRLNKRKGKYTESKEKDAVLLLRLNKVFSDINIAPFVFIDGEKRIYFGEKPLDIDKIFKKRRLVNSGFNDGFDFSDSFLDEGFDEW